MVVHVTRACPISWSPVHTPCLPYPLSTEFRRTYCGWESNETQSEPQWGYICGRVREAPTGPRGHAFSSRQNLLPGHKERGGVLRDRNDHGALARRPSLLVSRPHLTQPPVL